MPESQIPVSYLLSSKCSPDEVEKVVRSLSITPLYFVIVWDMRDVPLGAQFGVEVLKVQTEAEAIEFALFAFAEQEMPSLVIGGTEGLIAIYENGKQERIDVR